MNKITLTFTDDQYVFQANDENPIAILLEDVDERSLVRMVAIDLQCCLDKWGVFDDKK